MAFGQLLAPIVEQGRGTGDHNDDDYWTHNRVLRSTNLLLRVPLTFTPESPLFPKSLFLTTLINIFTVSL